MPFSSDEEVENNNGAEQVDFGSFSMTPGTSLNDVGRMAPVRDQGMLTRSKLGTQDSVLYGTEDVVVGLKMGEFLVMRGSFSLTVQRGAVEIDSVLYHADPEPIQICAPSLTSVPVVRCAQVTNRDLVTDQVTEDNEHMFTPDYKSIVLISNWETGLEQIGELYPPLKNIFPENEGRSLTFDLSLFDGSSSGLVYPKQWKAISSEIVDEVCEAHNACRVFLMGTKNSGKSTFVRMLANQSSSNEQSVVVLDLDPGQPDFSPPETISLTEVTRPIFGINLAQFAEKEHCEYIGYNSPQRDPEAYLNAVARLCRVYTDNYAPRNIPMLVNIPGWVKGFGVKLLEDLTDNIRPTHTVYLHASTPELDEELEGIPFGKILKAPGIFAQTTYSPGQRRHFNVLAYLHRIGQFRFNMTPLIQTVPYSVAYSQSLNEVDQTLGAIGIFDGADIEHEDVPLCIEATVVAIYSMDISEYLSVIPNIASEKENYPNYITDTNQLFDSQTLKFKGLALVHSVDTDRHLVNLYTPIDTKPLTDVNTKILLVRGRSEIPTQEIAPKDIVYKYNKKRKKNKQSDLGLPYISLNKTQGKGVKSLNVRRNIIRRR